MHYSDHVKDIKPDYDFDPINPTEYRLLFTFPVKGWLMEKIFNQGAKKLGYGNGKIPVNEFDAPPYYLNLLRAATRKWARQVNTKLRRDGTNMLSYQVLRANFIKNKNNVWNITVHGYGEWEQTILKKEEENNGKNNH